MILDLSGPPKVYTIAIREEKHGYSIFMGTERVQQLGFITDCYSLETAQEMVGHLRKAVQYEGVPTCIVWVKPRRRRYPEL